MTDERLDVEGAAPSQGAPVWQAELLTLYQATTQDLIFLKQQQWSVTNYVLLLDAALIGVRQLPGQARPLAVSLVAGVLALGGLVVLTSLERTIRASRERLVRINSRMSSEFQACLKGTDAGPKWPVFAILLGAIVAGAAIVCWLA